MLPGPHLQLVINLAHDHCTALAPSGALVSQAPALAVGLHLERHIIHTRDTEEVVGVTFQPAGARRVLNAPAHLLRSSELPLADLLGERATDRLRSALQQAATPAAKLLVLERDLLSFLLPGQPHPAVLEALRCIRQPSCPIERLQDATGISPRRLRSLFQEEVGVSPKVYARLLRFRHVLRQLHQGDDLPWAELALLCGYTDQSHFSNDFHAFSGISPSTFRRQTDRPWAGHLPQ